MRPNTLAEAVERIQAGSAQDVELAEFVDTFDLANTDNDRYASIECEPKLTGDVRLDALVGAIAEYLAKQRRLGRVPHWVSDPARRLTSPWFTTASPSDAMREYLTFASPAEFASRNIFTEERPLRRGRGRHGTRSRKVRPSRPEDASGRRGRFRGLGDPQSAGGAGQFSASIRRGSAGGGTRWPRHRNRDLPACRREDLRRGRPKSPCPPPHPGSESAGRGCRRGRGAGGYPQTRRARPEPGGGTPESGSGCSLAR